MARFREAVSGYARRDADAREAVRALVEALDERPAPRPLERLLDATAPVV